MAQAVIALKSVILSRAATTSSSLPNPEKLVARLAKQLDGITNPKARASVFWLVGQFAAQDEASSKIMGLGWEGIAPWVPDVLRKGVKGFANEVSCNPYFRYAYPSPFRYMSPKPDTTTTDI